MYCAFLRGVNVNGVKIIMEELRNVLVSAGFTGVKTILATGNVLFKARTGDSDREVLKKDVESYIGGYFKVDTHVFLRDREEIEAICERASEIEKPDDCHLYVLLCDDPEAVTKLTEIFTETEHEEGEQSYYRRPTDVLDCPKRVDAGKPLWYEGTGRQGI